ncbi:LytR/AlgR family response regulator transcription factor [Chryseobacterium sp. SIMBA_029]|uniref:LytR/AlgR family response regulator transcription factor n=1 Tax=Chryseobacterium sp. SIMBA_029 TaxID=3085772 RepID=UPI003978B8D2
MIRYKCVIIDDDVKSIDYLTQLIRMSFNLELVAAFQNPILALESLKKNQSIDFLFLDIEIGTVSGLDLVPIVRQYTKHIIIVTAHSKYAINAFQINADQFILKPYNELRFFTVINHLIDGFSEDQASQVPSKLFYLKGPNKNTFSQFNVDTIIAIEATKNYVNVYTSSQTIIGYHPLKEMHESLVGFPDFMKIHKSFIINTKHIQSVEVDTVKMTNDLIIPIAASQMQTFRKFLRERTFIAKRKVAV